MFFLVLACVLRYAGGISLLGEVNLVHDSVDNQRSYGAKIAGFDLEICVSFSATTIVTTT